MEVDIILIFISIIILIIILPLCWRKAVCDLARADKSYGTISIAKRADKNTAKPPVIKD